MSRVAEARIEDFMGEDKIPYLVVYNDGTAGFCDEAGVVIPEINEPGWYVKAGRFLPWGPFESQKEAIESLLIEWPRFEPDYFKEEE